MLVCIVEHCSYNCKKTTTKKIKEFEKDFKRKYGLKDVNKLTSISQKIKKAINYRSKTVITRLTTKLTWSWVSGIASHIISKHNNNMTVRAIKQQKHFHVSSNQHSFQKAVVLRLNTLYDK